MSSPQRDRQELSLLLSVLIAAFDAGALVVCRGFPRRIVIEVGSSSSGKPHRHWAHLLPPSPLATRSNRRTPSSRTLSHGTPVMLHAVAVEALWKEWEDALGHGGHSEGGRGGAVMAENIHDVVQAKAARLRTKLERMGPSLRFPLASHRCWSRPCFQCSTLTSHVLADAGSREEVRRLMKQPHGT